ncbi:potassium channel subfamily K member 18 isoform X2 [Panulirus ornatus]|uniref:potassium channel subfamily K member 18 isoform X2 n=1 Tax=Panulirus ornatus TaxID=150431 RepID=UPI003A8BE2DD
MREEGGQCGNCGYYLKNIIKFLISHIGLVSLVIGYTIVGAFTFKRLEAHHELEVKKNMSFVRLKVTDDLWGITDRMPVLNKTKWAHSVRERLMDFENSLIRSIKNDGWDGEESTATQQWTFAGALFYSIILITTIGYGNIAPKTDWGKVVTIFYAIPGVPLMMLCLANIGDGMAHSFRFLYWKVCCYACTKRPKKKRRGRSVRLSRRMDDDMVEADMRGLQRNRPSEQSHHTRSSQNSKGPDHLMPPPREDDGRVAVLFNKYALEKEGITHEDDRRASGRDHDGAVEMKPDHEGRDGSRRSRRDEEANLPVTHQPRGQHVGPNPGYSDSPPMPRSPRTSERYSRHLPPPDTRSRLSHLDDDYYYDDYDDEYDDDEEEDDIIGDRPVPIWLGVMLVVAYIFSGAFLFAEWEKWGFLDSVYFCFITLTTIGFGDFVPAQRVKENVELSIALCSIYLLFGIALLAMSFNLVQEEVISNVKNMAKRLGILKDEEGEDDVD